MNRFHILALIATVATPAHAEDSFPFALKLGDLIASEQTCGLSYDPDAVNAFIDQNVAADDIGFPDTLGMTTRSAARKQKDLAGIAKSAHCHAVERIAREHKFITE